MTKKEERARCHAARDNFFHCVEVGEVGGGNSANDLDTPDRCNRLKAEFERACPSSWVHHFALQRHVRRTDVDPLVGKNS